MPDKMYVQCRWHEIFPDLDELNIEAPTTFNEKLNWLKLYYHNPLLHKLVDKYEVKRYVNNIIGKEHLTMTYGVYETPKDIDYDKLPNQFVLKCTHDSGSIVICKDKNTFDKESAYVILDKGLAVTDYYYKNREWAYKGVKPRIIAEEYIDTLGKPDSIEYKLTCSYGDVKMVTVCSGIAHAEYSKRFNDNFDGEGNRLPFYVKYKPANKPYPSSDIIRQMKVICKKLVANIPECRVDFYVHDNRLYVGELTFYTWGGFIDYSSKEWDANMGDWFELPNMKWK